MNFLIEISENNNFNTFVDNKTTARYCTTEQIKEIIEENTDIEWIPIGSAKFLIKFNEIIAQISK